MKKTHPGMIIGTVSAASLAVIAVTLNVSGINEESLRLMLRETARISTLIFLLIFIASPLHKLMKSQLSKWLMIHRRYLGISFGVSHLIHLGLIIWLIATYSNGDVLSIAPLSSYIIGGLGYILIVAMLATSNDQSIKRLGHKRWKSLHTFGMYYLFVSLLVSYIGLLSQDFPFYVSIVAIFVLAALSRAFALFSGSVKLSSV